MYYGLCQIEGRGLFTRKRRKAPQAAARRDVANASVMYGRSLLRPISAQSQLHEPSCRGALAYAPAKRRRDNVKAFEQWRNRFERTKNPFETPAAPFEWIPL